MLLNALVIPLYTIKHNQFDVHTIFVQRYVG